MKKKSKAGSRILQNAALRILVPPLAGLLFYGGWAFLINAEFGPSVAFRAAATQGGYSFTITLLLALMIEWLFTSFKALPGRQWWAGSIACILLYSTSWGVNAITGTPNILLTILPGAAVSTVYTVIYVLTLIKIDNKDKKTAEQAG
ncbi:MAG: hypothetical protein ACJAUP_001617 [Cellvibrionaceae bacterium]|jgi:hypothetical protein